MIPTIPEIPTLDTRLIDETQFETESERVVQAMRVEGLVTDSDLYTFIPRSRLTKLLLTGTYISTDDQHLCGPNKIFAYTANQLSQKDSAYPLIDALSVRNPHLIIWDNTHFKKGDITDMDYDFKWPRRKTSAIKGAYEIKLD